MDKSQMQLARIVVEHVFTDTVWHFEHVSIPSAMLLGAGQGLSLVFGFDYSFFTGLLFIVVGLVGAAAADLCYGRKTIKNFIELERAIRRLRRVIREELAQ